jgi:ferredoxin
MATVITSECINCGACEPECPNTAIYAGGVAYDFNGVSIAAIASDIFYIVPDKCTECVGFHDHEACAAVCPVDCCVPDPKIPETEGALLARARVLHPELSIPEGGAAEAAPTNGAPTAKPAAPAPVQAASVASAAPVAVMIGDVEYNPNSWEVPVVCKDCNEPFVIPYRHFEAGVVFHCPNCSGSYVPKSTMYRAVKETFDGFYSRRRDERIAIERRHAREREMLTARQAAEMEEFKKRLVELALSMKPAGKVVRPRGIGAMFT